MARVKICGHTRLADVEASVAAGADAIGVIVDVPVDTPREVDPRQGADLLDVVPPFVTGVLVTMQDRVADVLELVETVRPDAVQVHGGLDATGMSELVARSPVPVIAVTDIVSAAEIDAFAGVADALLLDSRAPDGSGGTGRTHDWNAATAIRQEYDVALVLAGGLTPDNVGAAVETVDPFAVDVASGVEIEGGHKDHGAVERFVEEATRAKREVTL